MDREVVRGVLRRIGGGAVNVRSSCRYGHIMGHGQREMIV